MVVHGAPVQPAAVQPNGVALVPEARLRELVQVPKYFFVPTGVRRTLSPTPTTDLARCEALRWRARDQPTRTAHKARSCLGGVRQSRSGSPLKMLSTGGRGRLRGMSTGDGSCCRSPRPPYWRFTKVAVPPCAIEGKRRSGLAERRIGMYRSNRCRNRIPSVSRTMIIPPYQRRDSCVLAGTPPLVQRETLS